MEALGRFLLVLGSFLHVRHPSGQVRVVERVVGIARIRSASIFILEFLVSSCSVFVGIIMV